MKILPWAIIQALISSGLCIATNTSAESESKSSCANTRDPQPIAIHLNVEYIVAECAPTPTGNTTVLAARKAIYDVPPLDGYSRVMASVLIESRERARAREWEMMGERSWSWWIESQLEGYLVRNPWIEGLWRGVGDMVGFVLKPILGVFGVSMSGSGSGSKKGMTPMTAEEIKEGFKQGFQVIHNNSMEARSTNITSAVMVTPAFFWHEIKVLVNAAAEEMGIIPVSTASPQELIMAYGDKILDERIPASEVEVVYGREDNNVLVLDYGSVHFHIQTTSTTTSQCVLRSGYQIDEMGWYRVIWKLTERVIARYELLQWQIEKGASYDGLLSAILMARRAMLMQRSESESGSKSGDESTVASATGESPYWDKHSEWPMELRNWWVGMAGEEERMVFLPWEDVEDAENGYVHELGAVLDRALMCVQSAQTEENQQQTGPIDTVIIFGNDSDRLLIHRGVRQSVGDHVKIIGASSKLDVGLAARAGARLARRTHEHIEKMRESMEAEEEAEDRRRRDQVEEREKKSASRAGHNEL